MTQRFTLILLILCTLGYSSAWAFDSHIEQPDGQAEEPVQVFLLDDHHQNGNDQQNEDSDHCSHAGAHMLGLINPKTIAAAPEVSATVHAYIFHFQSHQNSPPHRPPLS